MGLRADVDSPGPVTLPGLPPPKPIPLKERAALVFVERAQIDVLDGAFVAIDADGVRDAHPSRRHCVLDAGTRSADQPRGRCPGREGRDARDLGR